MTWWQGLLLGILQGATEFLPISSSGHLVLLQHFFDLSLSAQETLVFDIFIHLGTLLALIHFYRKELAPLFWALCTYGTQAQQNEDRNRASLKLIAFLVIATVPAVIVALTMKDAIEMAFSDMRSIGMQFILTAFALFSIQWATKRMASHGVLLSWWRALVIGIAQALAIIPAISRSGATVVAGVWLKLSPAEATRFSFLLAIPALAGAAVFALFDVSSIRVLALPAAWWGFASSAVVGWLCLDAFLRIVRRGKLHWFAYYCLVLGIICLWVFY